jgi:putative sigma-54 modulation protein
MHILITSRHEVLTEALKEYIEKKIYHLEKYIGKITEARVILNFEKKSHICELTLLIGKMQLSSRGISRDMYQSIDASIQRLGRQASKQKKRVVKKRRENQNIKKFKMDDSKAFLSDDEKLSKPKIIRSTQYSVKPMTVEEAVAQLVVSDSDFLIFQNAETEKPNVVYRRKDKNIGWIEPES